MKPDELLGVGIRLCAIGLLVAGFIDTLDAFLRFLGLYANQAHTTDQVVVAAACYYLLGAILLLGADFIVRLAYWRR